ncbi:MAG TPA: hypothetical protein VL614_05000 [Acetobacteraceae bacterium]|nr:hypothetical protein [Acetobacteraceae bacterium]
MLLLCRSQWRTLLLRLILCLLLLWRLILPLLLREGWRDAKRV